MRHEDMKDREPLIVGNMTPAFVKANPDAASSLPVRTPPLRNNSYDFILQSANPLLWLLGVTCLIGVLLVLVTMSFNSNYLWTTIL